MNYLKHYVRLIRKAEDRDSVEGYTEKHHVFPKSIFGENKRLVKLTVKEHYIAHALLEKGLIQRYGINNPKAFKMVRAFYIMNNMSNHKCSRLYESNRFRYSETLKGVPRSPETIEKMKKPKHLNHGKLVSKARKGMKFSEEHKRNLSKAHEKRTYYAKGHKFTEEQRKNHSLGQKNRPPITEETRQKLSQKTKEVWDKRKAKTLEESLHVT